MQGLEAGLDETLLGDNYFELEYFEFKNVVKSNILEYTFRVQTRGQFGFACSVKSIPAWLELE